MCSWTRVYLEVIVVVVVMVMVMVMYLAMGCFGKVRT